MEEPAGLPTHKITYSPEVVFSKRVFKFFVSRFSNVRFDAGLLDHGHDVSADNAAIDSAAIDCAACWWSSAPGTAAFLRSTLRCRAASLLSFPAAASWRWSTARGGT